MADTAPQVPEAATVPFPLGSACNELSRVVSRLSVMPGDAYGCSRSVGSTHDVSFLRQPDQPSAIYVRGWVLTSQRTHISPDEICDRLSTKIGFPPPEMLFGANYVMAYHLNSGFCMRLSAAGALATVGKDPTAKEVKVSISKKWNERRADLPETKVKEVKYDWTYTPRYDGDCFRFHFDEPVSLGPSSTPVASETVAPKADALEATAIAAKVLRVHASGPANAAAGTESKIDFELLKRPDPILWNDNVTLFEDELHDHGAAALSAKVRVMPDRWYILMRFWIRVDEVMLRIRDVRIYHQFGEDHIHREYSEREVTFEELAKDGHPTKPTEYSNPDKFAHLLRRTQYRNETVKL